MSPHHNNRRAIPRVRSAPRRALTLIELMMVTTILVMMAGAMAALATVVESGRDFNQENSVTTQHGRVALERMERAISSAHASEAFPGCFVYSEQLNGWSYPDTLIVWSPTDSAADPDGQPMINELVVYCPNPLVPAELLEIRMSNAAGVAPSLDNSLGWQTLMTQFKKGNGARRVVLTNLLRVASPTADGIFPRRGVVRFGVTLRPSAAEWDEYKQAARDWEDLWAQSIHGSGTGLRQTWCRLELQFQMDRSSESGADTTIPFFGSGTVYHELHRS